ncbi:MAG: pyridoxal-phosphate dependent enzyme [Azospirillaceae bacterium]|nr:pyridoxal-phosphate dependent enzyme [Azospirillaceae bacterium]
MTWRATCVECGATRAWSHPQAAGAEQCSCPAGGNLALMPPLGPAARSALLAAIADGDATHWRYAPLLPAPRPTAGGRAGIRLPVGWTPLIDCGVQGASGGGVRLLVKDETRNPSGSLKDRASDVVVAAARARGVTAFVAASTGNAAASLACIGAAAGVAITILVPATVPPAKLAQIRAYGATVRRVAGSYDDAWELAAQVARHTGLHNRSTGINPVTREGKKTCALEIAEQMGWQAPDWVVVPTGDGNILSAIWKGFCELRTLGLIGTLPRLVAAQAAASDAIARAHWGAGGAGLDPAIAVDAKSADTLADSISVSWPRDRAAALAALRDSRGLAVTVTEAEIVAGVRALASRFGLFVEPSSAAAFAAFERVARSGHFEAGQRVVCLATGTGLKDLRAVAADTDEAALVAAGDWRAVADALPLATGTGG